MASQGLGWSCRIMADGAIVIHPAVAVSLTFARLCALQVSIYFIMTGLWGLSLDHLTLEWKHRMRTWSSRFMLHLSWKERLSWFISSRLVQCLFEKGGSTDKPANRKLSWIPSPISIASQPARYQPDKDPSLLSQVSLILSIFEVWYTHKLLLRDLAQFTVDEPLWLCDIITLWRIKWCHGKIPTLYNDPVLGFVFGPPKRWTYIRIVSEPEHCVTWRDGLMLS